MFENPFDDAELATRAARLRQRMAERQLDVALISTPENVFYFTGLDHWGYFAPHLLIVPADGEMVLITRAMERVSIEKQVRNAAFRGHADTETAADLGGRILTEIMPSRVGIESWSAGLSHGFAHKLREAVANAELIDITGMADALRLVKSPAEQTLMRRAAKVTDAATAAAIDAIRDGAPEREVAAECVAAMIRAGGDPVGFGPFIRPGSRLGEEHGTTGDGAFKAGEPVFLELSGCVRRYHAPIGRLVHLGGIRDKDAAMAETVKRAFDAVVAALQPGTTAGAVYQAWQDVVDAAGLSHYRRHHCGYLVGIGIPPSWVGGSRVTGLRAGSDLVIEAGMSFHVLSWLMGTGHGDYFMSNPVLLTETGAEILTETPFGPIVK
ncbi:MAG: aminopeptidase P family protein [Rhizobiaceae bacterium]|nr:aminopeptidase P family protein [Rhizobiaceae bacterium]